MALNLCLEFLDVKLRSWCSFAHTLEHQEIPDKRLLTVPVQTCIMELL